jgi:hypothetical protein
MKGEIALLDRNGRRAGSSENAQNPIAIRNADQDNGMSKQHADVTDKTFLKSAATAEPVRAAARSRTPDEDMRQDEEAAAQRKTAEDARTGPLLEPSTGAVGGPARATCGSDAHTMEPGGGSKDAQGHAIDGVDDMIENYATPHGVDDVIENYILMLEKNGSEDDFIMVSVDINAGSTATASVSKDAHDHDMDHVDDIIENYMRVLEEPEGGGGGGGGERELYRNFP